MGKDEGDVKPNRTLYGVVPYTLEIFRHGADDEKYRIALIENKGDGDGAILTVGACDYLLDGGEYAF